MKLSCVVGVTLIGLVRYMAEAFVSSLVSHPLVFLSRRAIQTSYYYGLQSSIATVTEVPPEGERTIVDDSEVDAKCPYLGLPLKRGKINESGPGGDPEIICNFHNSCFNMKTGECNKWVTGVLGFENSFISGVMDNVGSEKKDLKSYQVVENSDGTLTVQDWNVVTVENEES
eukprot:scaffold278418_cov53-Attheya_sp.AAC.3